MDAAIDGHKQLIELLLRRGAEIDKHKLYDEKCSRNLVASKAALLEGRPALGIVLLTDSTV